MKRKTTPQAKKPPATKEKSETLPVFLTRPQWEEVLRALGRANATLNQMTHIRNGLAQEGEQLIIHIDPAGVRWIGATVLKGTELGEEVFRQWHFFTKFVPLFDQPGQFVFLQMVPAPY